MTLVLANRRELYRTPALADVSNNGGSRINQRLLLMMRKLCNDFGERGLVDDLVRAQAGQGRRKRKTPPDDEEHAKVERKDEAGGDDKEERGDTEERDVKPKLEM